MSPQQELELARAGMQVAAEQMARHWDIFARSGNPAAAHDRLAIIEISFWRWQARVRKLEATSPIDAF